MSVVGGALVEEVLRGLCQGVGTRALRARRRGRKGVHSGWPALLVLVLTRLAPRCCSQMSRVLIKIRGQHHGEGVITDDVS